MTKSEFLYEHDYELIIDLISRDVYMNNPESSQIDNEVYKAGDIL